MKSSSFFSLWAVIVIVFIFLIGEVALRALASPARFLFLGDTALFVWGLLMLFGGIFSLSSFFFETKWKGFQTLIWVYRTIIPLGGRLNAIIFGVIGILIGFASIIKVLSLHLLLVPFFLSSINLDNLSISPGLIL